MKERYFNNFKLHFPVTAKLTEAYRQTGLFDLTIKLMDGTAVIYDDLERSIRKLPLDCFKMTEKECRREFGLRLCKLMKIKNVTQQDLSEMTGISRVTINKYINGKANANFYNADKIAKALKCSMDELRYID